MKTESCQHNDTEICIFCDPPFNGRGWSFLHSSPLRTVCIFPDGRPYVIRACDDDDCALWYDHRGDHEEHEHVCETPIRTWHNHFPEDQAYVYAVNRDRQLTLAERDARHEAIVSARSEVTTRDLFDHGLTGVGAYFPGADSTQPGIRLLRAATRR
jgi:hypothetical protein